MALTRMEHFLVVTDDIEACKDFYCDVLGFEDGMRPPVGFPGYWLYLGDVPCIHIADRAAYKVVAKDIGLSVSEAAPGTGPLDHIAFNADGFAAFREHLDKRGIDYATNRVPGPDFWQIFLHDPDGIKIELNFPNDTGPQ